MGPIVATFLLTGGRKTEIFSLELRDIDFANEQVHVRPNVWRNLKRARHKRSVPLWPQLSGILKPYLAGLGRDSGLLFPAPTHGGMMDDVRWQLDKALERAKITKPREPPHVQAYIRRRCGCRQWTTGSRSAPIR